MQRGAGLQDTLVSRALICARAGDRDACAFLYARYADDVYLHVRRILDDHDEAREVVEHVFARLTHAIGGYEEREGPFLHWTLRLARRVAGEHMGRRPAPMEELSLSAHSISRPSAPPPMPR